MASFFQEIEIPNQKHFTDSPPFPAVLGPNSVLSPPSLADFTSAIKFQKPHLESLLHKTGAILFRGFPISSAAEFDQVVESFGYTDQPYLGGTASRTNVVGRVYTANDSPPDRKIPFHHEMTYAAEYPKKLFFFCEVAPGSGGETPLVLSHVVYERMRDKYPDFVERLEKEGMVSRRVMGEEDDPSSAIGRGWKSMFSTDDKLVAEQSIATSRAAELGVKLEWIGDGSMRRVIGPNQPIKHDKSRDRKIWFNGMVTSYTAFGDEVTFGSGDALPGDAVYHCLQIMEEESVAIPWMKGDVLFIDNLAVLHGRKHFTPPRRVLAALCK
ncbi:unnamed protein product [Linum tenue]|uniref:TauD/TfdA-like domain-containing protein n=2 Tax=Linum tenue TaxID=586396 RepID=A0AAV0KNT9_9ROSI|nr:unnamed protein product [Linum tenue]